MLNLIHSIENIKIIISYIRELFVLFCQVHRTNVGKLSTMFHDLAQFTAGENVLIMAVEYLNS